MRSISPLLLAALASACGVACSSSADDASSTPTPAPTAAIVADLRGDSNRDGEVRFDESDAVKTTWDAKNGAVFLANIDDDKLRCPTTGEDVDLASCNDATNETIDGADDVLDLARLKTKPWPGAPDGASAVVSVNAEARELVRLFKRTGPEAADFEVLAPEATLSAEEIRAGVELAIEGKDIVRDHDKWDGFVTVTLTISVGADSAHDDVKMRIAPVMTYHHLLAAEEVFASDTGTSGNRAMRTDLSAACTSVKLPTPTLIDDDDQWTQDYFETAFMSMPGPGGAQHVIRVNLRSANVYEPTNARSPLRPAGQVVFAKLRGKDSAGVQQYDIAHDQGMDSLDSFGNLETIPPYTLGDKTYPFGRIIRGATPTFHPDKTFSKMVESQGMQPPVLVDTSWLEVGHVDETMSFVKASTPRGWALLIDDPALAKKMLEAEVAKGNGATPMFVGESWYDDNNKASPAQTTIEKVLADTIVMGASAEASTHIAAQLAVLKTETGLTDAEIVRIPALHTTAQDGSFAYVPGLVNGVYVADGHFVAPNPHGPLVDGKDIFETAMIAALAPLGITAHFAEDWQEYHSVTGEVHCGSNTRRKIPDTKWWEAGR